MCVPFAQVGCIAAGNASTHPPGLMTVRLMHHCEHQTWAPSTSCNRPWVVVRRPHLAAEVVAQRRADVLLVRDADLAPPARRTHRWAPFSFYTLQTSAVTWCGSRGLDPVNAAQGRSAGQAWLLRDIHAYSCSLSLVCM